MAYLSSGEIDRKTNKQEIKKEWATASQSSYLYRLQVSITVPYLPTYFQTFAIGGCTLSFCFTNRQKCFHRKLIMCALHDKIKLLQFLDMVCSPIARSHASFFVPARIPAWSFWRKEKNAFKPTLTHSDTHAQVVRSLCDPRIMSSKPGNCGNSSNMKHRSS